MALEDILKKIELDAQAQAKTVLDEAHRKEKEILSAAQGDAEKVSQEIIEGAKAQAQKEKMRIASETAMKSKLALLKEKQSLIEEAFARATDALMKLDESSYKALLKSMVQKNTQTGSQEIVYVERSSGGGVIIKGERVQINMTFPKIMEQLKPALISAVAKILFS